MVTLDKDRTYRVGNLRASHSQILYNLKGLANGSRMLNLYGTTREVRRALDSTPFVGVRAGPAFEGLPGWSMKLTQQNLSNLMAVEREYPGVQTFMHFTVSDDKLILIEAFDVSDGMLLISSLLPLDEMNGFCQGLGLAIESTHYQET